MRVKAGWLRRAEGTGSRIPFGADVAFLPVELERKDMAKTLRGQNLLPQKSQRSTRPRLADTQQLRLRKSLSWGSTEEARSE